MKKSRTGLTINYPTALASDADKTTTQRNNKNKSRAAMEIESGDTKSFQIITRNEIDTGRHIGRICNKITHTGAYAYNDDLNQGDDENWGQ